MFYIEKTIEISASHKLNLDYESKCQNLHGHNWMVTIYCRNHILNKNDMVIDFADIKKITSELDHSDLNKFIPQPTAENIARYLCCKIPFCYKVKVIESKDNIAVYVKN